MLLNAIRAFLGFNLKPRTLDITLAIPPQSKRGKKPLTQPLKLKTLLNQCADDSVVLLQQVEQQLMILNRYPLSADTCFSVLKFMTIAVLPLMERLPSMATKRTSIPLAAADNQLICLSAQVCRQFSIAYKRLFQQDYNGSNWHYMRHRDRLHLCAFRILEWCYLEQKLLCLRYQTLPEEQWHDVNQVFHVMIAYERVDVFRGCLTKRLQAQEQLQGKAITRQTTLQQLFMQMHMLHLIDHLGWSVEFMPHIEAYLAQSQQKIDIQLLTDGSLPAGHAVVYLHQNRPAFLKAAPAFQSQPAVTINVQPLRLQLQHDLQDLEQTLRQQQLFNTPSSLKMIPQKSQLLFLRNMSQGLYREQWQPLDDCQGQDIALMMYTGFKECYLQLRDLSQTKTGGYREQRAFKDTLAQRSAMIGADETATAESRWMLLDETAQQIDLLTQETQYTHAMDFGALVTLSRPDMPIVLGYISRIQRHERINKLKMTIEKVQGQLDVARFCLPSKVDDKGGYNPAIILHMPGDEGIVSWLLIPEDINHLSYFKGQGKSILLQVGGQDYHVELGDVASLTAQFKCYRIAQMAVLQNEVEQAHA